MYKKEKKDLAESLKNIASTKECALVLSHKNITFAQIDKARRMSEKGTKIIKIKNKIAQKAFEGSVYKEIVKNLTKENLFIFGEDFFEACKIAKSLEQDVPNTTVLKAASKENKNHDLSFISELATLGSIENLHSKTLNVISEVIKKTLRVIDARCEKMKEEGK